MSEVDVFNILREEIDKLRQRIVELERRSDAVSDSIQDYIKKYDRDVLPTRLAIMQGDPYARR